MLPLIVSHLFPMWKIRPGNRVSNRLYWGVNRWTGAAAVVRTLGVSDRPRLRPLWPTVPSPRGYAQRDGGPSALRDPESRSAEVFCCCAGPLAAAHRIPPTAVGDSSVHPFGRTTVRLSTLLPALRHMPDRHRAAIGGWQRSKASPSLVLRRRRVCPSPDFHDPKMHGTPG